MPKKKPDLSRLVMLTMTPSEAAVLQGLLQALQGLLQALQSRAEVPQAYARIAAECIDSIDLQLRHLQWPERNKAPFPL